MTKNFMRTFGVLLAKALLSLPGRAVVWAGRLAPEPHPWLVPADALP